MKNLIIGLALFFLPAFAFSLTEAEIQQLNNKGAVLICNSTDQVTPIVWEGIINRQIRTLENIKVTLSQPTITPVSTSRGTVFNICVSINKG